MGADSAPDVDRGVGPSNPHRHLSSQRALPAEAWGAWQATRFEWGSVTNSWDSQGDWQSGLAEKTRRDAHGPLAVLA